MKSMLRNACFILALVHPAISFYGHHIPTLSRGDGASTISIRRGHPIGFPMSSTPTNVQEKTDTSVKVDPDSDGAMESPLSDVDARVLREMLQEQKLDLQTEADVLKLLERGTVKRTERPPSAEEKLKMKQKEENDDDSIFSSTLIKTLADTKLWRKVSAQANDLLETAKIWVTNKIEADVKVMAALGLFAWERAVRDVARALPEASSRARSLAKTTTFVLTNSSSFADMKAAAAAAAELERQARLQDIRSTRDEMNRPSDEIRTVLRSVLDILSGEQTSTSSSTPRKVAVNSVSARGLRTAAPAGSVNAGERRQRAYRQRRKIDQAENDIRRIPTGFIDTAYELTRELKAESSAPGYKTAPIRNAIEAGWTETGNFLRSVREEARLSAARRKELRLKQATEANSSSSAATTGVPSVDEAVSASTKSVLDDVFQDGDSFDAMEEEVEREFYNLLLKERTTITAQLKACIQEPQNTWLQPELLASLQQIPYYKEDGTVFKPQFNQEQLRDIVTRMILVRNEIEARISQEDEIPIEELLAELRTVRNSIEEIQALAAEAVSSDVAKVLRNALFGLPEDIDLDDMDSQPLIFRLEAKDDIMQEMLEARAEAVAVRRVAQNEARAKTYAAADESESRQVYKEAKSPKQDMPSKKAAWFAADIVVENDRKGDIRNVSFSKHNLDVIEPEIFAAEAVDAIPENVVMTVANFESNKERAFVESDADSLGAGLIAEVVSDEDFNVAVGESKAFDHANDFDMDEEEAEKMDNIVAIATLRSLDVFFFVLEKTVTVTVPKAIKVGKTASERLTDLQQSGKGTTGWKQVRNAANAKSRY